MPAAVKRIFFLSLVLILSFTLVGCEEGVIIQDGAGLTQEEIDQIVANATTAQFDTVNLDIDTQMVVEVVGGSEAGEMTMVADGIGVMDMANKEMQMTMNMAINIPEMGEREMAVEVFFVGEWMYSGIDIPDIGEQWIKVKATQDIWQQQSQIDQQIEFLKTAVEVKSLPGETVNGADCYVFEVIPSIEALGELLSQQTSSMGGMDFSQFNLADLFQEMSVKEWIAKDSYQVMKTEIDMLMQISPEAVGATEADFEKMTMDMNMGVRFYDYNQPVSITLPQEALNAQETSY